MKNTLTIFENFKIRRQWDKKEEKWYFSVVDIVAILTDSSNPTDYLKKLRKRDSELGNYIGTNCPQVEMLTQTGKKRKTLTGNTEQIFRIIQSIPSKKAEPFKRWLAKAGKERIDEINNPELAMDRMRQLYDKKGYPKDWTDKRVRGIAVRQDLTREWQDRGALKSIEFAILTNEIMQGTFDMKVDEYKNLKGLKKENLRDHMDDIELILTMLAEATTTRITRDRDSKGFPRLRKDARDGGAVGGRTRRDIELTSGKKVANRENYLPKNSVKKIQSKRDA